jgi:hypothetical protein
MPFSDSELKFLKVDGVTGDRGKKKIKTRESRQCATARFMAVCRVHGTGKLLNPVVMDRI